MKKQFILAGTGAILVTVIFIFGRTTESKKIIPDKQPDSEISTFNIRNFIDSARLKLTPSQNDYISTLENNVKRGDVHNQQLTAFDELANFWKDSARSFEPYAFYLSESAKLDNSEKKLTFAAQLFLEYLRGEHDEAKLNWETDEAIHLFEKALELDPENDELKIGLGSCYVYGKGRNGDPNEVMKGIRNLLSVVRKDSNNMKAQLVLGAGGVVSRQYASAIKRLQKVISADPDNQEAVAFLADAYAGNGEKEEAIKWYNISKRLINNPRYSKEVDERIKMLR